MSQPDASLACSHFGSHTSYFSRWMARFDTRRLSSLEDKKTSPLTKRRPEYSRDFIAKVRKIREDNPTYSCRKIHAILSRETDEAGVPSAATIPATQDWSLRPCPYSL
ncbi:MAG: helix-turn-helix domain-containing protein [Dysgonamonadaceae bacterium]|nr:helix-turn-helix domain-containing protein [Dysgonamonadaceae bacterium]